MIYFVSFYSSRVEEAADEQQMSGPGSVDIPVSLEGTEIEKDTGILPSRYKT